MLWDEHFDLPSVNGTSFLGDGKSSERNLTLIGSGDSPARRVPDGLTWRAGIVWFSVDRGIQFNFSGEAYFNRANHSSGRYWLGGDVCCVGHGTGSISSPN